MNEKNEKKRRRYMREKFSEKINSDASKALKLEIFRLARNRDILGAFLIASVGAIIALSVLLYLHW